MNPNPVTMQPSIALVVLALILAAITVSLIATIILAKQPVLRIIAGFLVFIMVGSFVVVMGIRLATPRVRHLGLRYPEQNGLGRPEFLWSQERPWDATTDDALTASIYSSVESAAGALCRSCIETLFASHAESPREIRVILSDELADAHPALGTQLATVLREASPLSQVSHCRKSAADAPSAEAVTIEIDAPTWVRESQAPWDQRQSYARGDLRMSGRYRDVEDERLAPFSEKPWVEQFDQFISARPDRRYVVAESDRLAGSERAASENAREIASKILGPIIAQSAGVPLSPAIENSARRALDQDRLIVDQFSQKLITSSGELWRTKLLIDASPNRYARLASEYRHTAPATKLRRDASLAGFAALMALILLLYFVLNELTKGYFVWNLLFTTMLTVLVLTVAFCWWMNVVVGSERHGPVITLF